MTANNKSLRNMPSFTVHLERGQDDFLRRLGAGNMALGLRTLIEDRIKAERANSHTLVLRDFLAAADKHPELATSFLESTSKQWEGWS